MKHLDRSILLVVAIFYAGLVHAATYTVTSTADSGAGSLREAVGLANAASDLDTIEFNTGGGVITLNSVIQLTNPVIIDGGGTQVVRTSNAASGIMAFHFTTGSNGSTLQNLAVIESYAGVWVYPAVDGLTITGCRFGTDWDGNTGCANLRNMELNGLSNGVIGGSTSGDRNIIVSGSTYGVNLLNCNAVQVQGNFIGIGPDGVTAMPNVSYGIGLNNSFGCLIGGDRSNDEGNIISGNTSAYGISIGSNAGGNTICGNIIGLSADETTVVANNRGVFSSSVNGNSIGLASANYENIISGNSYGVYFNYSNNNIVQNNLIGLSSAGTVMGNSTGLYVNYGGNNLIGGYQNTAFYQRNVISGNTSYGIRMYSGGNTICGNYIGTTLDGISPAENAYGFQLSTSYGNLIGGPNTDSDHILGNVICSHDNSSSYGIQLNSGGGNTLVGNYIGLTAAGTQGLPNYYGVQVNSGMGPCVIGGSNTMLANHFGKNDQAQIYFSSTTQPHCIQGNFFGLTADGTEAFSHNSSSQIYISASSNLLIGGTSPGEGNKIAGYGNGVHMFGGSGGNTVVGNIIGLLGDGVTQPVQHMERGISAFSCPAGNLFGIKDTIGNLISGATYAGIYVQTGSLMVGVYSNTIVACSSPYLQSSGANNDKAAPVITQTSLSTISGTAEANDYIEVFLSDGSAASQGGSIKVLGHTTADGAGNWSVSVSGVTFGNIVTAIATDSSNNSSVFAVNVAISNPTPTFTITPTVTPTPTASPTATVTFSATITLTASETFTCTATPTETETPTQTPTSSATPTATLSATVTLTASETFTCTATTTATPTQTATVTATATPTPTATLTFSATPQDTATNTPTITVTGTITLTPTPTPTTTVSPTITHTGTITMTGTATPMVTITDTPGTSPTAAFTATLTPKVPDAIKSYPNPARDQAIITLPKDVTGDIAIHIFNASGERIAVIRENTVAGQGIIWHCNQAGPGIYWLRVVHNGKEVKKLKIAVVR